MKQKVDVIIDGEPGKDVVMLKELVEWCGTKGYEIKRGIQWNIVEKPAYTGADGNLKPGGEDGCVTHEFLDGKVMARGKDYLP